MAKYLLIAAIVISLATAGLGFVNHGKLADTLASLDLKTSQLATSQKNLAASQAAEKKATATAEALDADKTKLAADLSASQAAATKAQGDLDAATKAGADKDTQIAALQKKLDDIANSGTTNPTPGQDPKQLVDGLNQQIQELTAALATANDQLKTAQSAVADYKKKDADRVKGLMQPGLEGRVLAVNPAWNFVVLSIGDKQGAVNNAEMLLKRGGQYLGKVRITSVEPSTSIADIVANTLPAGVAVQPGDSVIFQAQE